MSLSIDSDDSVGFSVEFINDLLFDFSSHHVWEVSHDNSCHLKMDVDELREKIVGLLNQLRCIVHVQESLIYDHEDFEVESL